MRYYGFLATRVAPRRLLTTAARRALRVTWNRLAPPLAPSSERLLAGLGCRDGDAVARLLSWPRPMPPPYTPDALGAALDRHLPGERERARARAEAAAEGRLIVFGREVDVRRPDGGTDWQRDPAAGRHFAGWAPSQALPPAPGLDPKLAWAVGRGEQWVALACGIVLDGRRASELAHALSASVLDFAAANPVGQGVQWACAMEAALRAWNLALALWIASARGAALEPEAALEAARLLVATGRFVLAHLEDDTAVPNNHLAADWLGVLACGEALPAWEEAPRWRSLALAGLARELAAQVHADGTTFEGSVPYHRLAVEIFACGGLLARAARRPLGAGYARRLAAAFRATRALLSDSGELPQIGDNDSGRVLALRERGALEAGYLLPLGAALLSAPALLAPGHPAVAAEVAWLLGPAALERLAAASPGPARRSASFPAGGFHVLRRGALEAFVSCGANGQRGIGGHSHNDKLALELRAGGARVVCDPGSPTYTGDPELRNAFRSTRAHATVVVDGLEQVPLPAERLFALPEGAAARVLAFESAECERLAGEHRGYARTGLVHRREVIVADGGAAIVDRLEARGTHAVELRWPLAEPRARLRIATDAELAALAGLARLARVRRGVDPVAVVEVPLAAGGHVLIGFACPAGLAPELAPALWSPGYAQLSDGSVVLLAGPVACPAVLVTVFLHLPRPDAAAS